MAIAFAGSMALMAKGAVFWMNHSENRIWRRAVRRMRQAGLTEAAILSAEDPLAPTLRVDNSTTAELRVVEPDFSSGDELAAMLGAYAYLEVSRDTKRTVDLRLTFDDGRPPAFRHVVFDPASVALGLLEGSLGHRMAPWADPPLAELAEPLEVAAEVLLVEDELFEQGDAWAYRTGRTVEKPVVVIGDVVRVNGEIFVHVQIVNAEVTNPAAPGGVQRVVPHLVVPRLTLVGQVTGRVEGVEADWLAFETGRRMWFGELAGGEAPVFSRPFSEILGVLMATDAGAQSG